MMAIVSVYLGRVNYGFRKTDMEENKPPQVLSTSQHKKNGINLPLDLAIDILRRLPAKSLARSRCVSKQWETVIGDYIVKNSIVPRSLAQPPPDARHFIMDILVKNRVHAFSYAYPHQITNENNQFYQEKIFGRSKDTAQFQYLRGLIGFGSPKHGKFTIHNPTTGQCVSLPDVGIPWRFYLFGYDPLRNQYKVACLSMSTIEPEKSCKVFTFGDPAKQWRKCSSGHYSPFEYLACPNEAVCINGKIYYTAMKIDGSVLRRSGSVLISFSVETERFNHVQAPENIFLHRGDVSLVNYQGKLGCIGRNNLNNEDMDVWVMESAEKQEWSKITHGCASRNTDFAVSHPGGEIIIVPDLYCKFASDVYYYSPNNNRRSRLVIQTPTSSQGYFRIWPVAEPVENIMSLL
ncbi:hypothetical protein HID58_052610 [Brassica napus]|uniref:F-box domain-containing protein n=1 Tax=Brassica napus TaxID=3708 RepID=A0ABQ8ADI3_BRANA|nr:hypothetical protein HID58_052610 [Brassica napus]